MTQTLNLLPQRPRRRHLGLKITGLLLLIAFLGSGAMVVYAYAKIKVPRSALSHEKQFEVYRGETLAAVARRLARDRLISSAVVMRVYATVSGLSNKIQAGTYRLDSSTSAQQILEQLTAGKIASTARTVVFPEGLTVDDYGQRLERAGVVSGEALKQAQKNFTKARGYLFLADRPTGRDLEGYLFPDTYQFAKAVSAEEVVGIFLKNFDRKLSSELRQEILRQKKTIFETVIMASLIEAEVGRNFKPGTKLSDQDVAALSQERRLVASVFYNRLKAGHALESDATVEYLTHSRRARATLEETAIDSPYNTYRHVGLPPGPINNPSIDSIKAAIYPADSDYFYFLSKPDGEAVFSKTLEEHNENKAKYLK